MPGPSKSDVVRQYIKRFPDAASLTIAKKAYKDNKALWSSVEACRNSVRYVRGNLGDRNRGRETDKSCFRPNGKAGTGFGSLPEGLVDIDNFVPFEIDQPGKYTILSDAHVPYHDKVALTLALEYIKDPTGVILNGDMMDHYSLSQWQKDPRRRFFKEELDVCRQVLRTIRESLPHARIIWKLGNHEERYVKYMEVKAPELLDIPDFSIESLHRCDELGIEMVKDMRPIKLGKLSLIHGHEYKFSISNPVNPARGLFLRGKSLALCGHFHQSSSHSENTLDDRRISCWSNGCLCDLHPRYMPLNKWNHGFAAIEIDKGGAFSVQNNRIMDGKVYA